MKPKKLEPIYLNDYDPGDTQGNNTQYQVLAIVHKLNEIIDFINHLSKLENEKK